MVAYGDFYHTLAVVWSIPSHPLSTRGQLSLHSPAQVLDVGTEARQVALFLHRETQFSKLNNSFESFLLRSQE
jgi:hypothetical protein